MDIYYASRHIPHLIRRMNKLSIMIQVITINEKSKWIEYIDKSLQYDFYHTWSYHSIEISGDPLLLVFQEADIFIALPLIKRRIKNSGYFDLTSIYGYTGPISNIKLEDLNDRFLENYKKSFLDFLFKGKFVSVFCRLNPFLNQQRFINMFGGLHDNGKTVAINLVTTYEEQKTKYRRSLIKSIKQLKRNGYYIQEGSIADIHTFSSIYTDNMKRVGACTSYYFDEAYLSNILLAKEYNSKLLFVKIGDKAISGGVFTYTNGIMQVHLLATSPQFLSVSPAKLLIDEATIIGRKLNTQYCHLGGGVGFKEDSLFNWKAGFSDFHLNYYSWRFIADEVVYNVLLDEAGIEKNNQIDFFPLYRHVAPQKASAIECVSKAV